MKILKKDLLTIKILPTNGEMGECAARDAAEYIEKLFDRKDEVNIVFAAAPSQNTFLEALLKLPVKWEKINALHMDEYIGLPSDAPQGFGNFLSSHIFSKANFHSVNYIRADGLEPEALCERYTAILENFRPDIVFMGIGENGHIAFNDPDVADFDDPKKVKVVLLDDICRQQQVNDGCFGDISEVPTHAITLTIPTLTFAKKIFCVVPRSTKANAVKSLYFGEISPKCPASILRTHCCCTLYCDCESAKYI